ncbi:MAG: acyltransferase [Paramuribaculum sp.]|nr:acyltransferase [Paramuribaculum sp.]
MRQSNAELLRILSMMFVVMVHLDGAALSLPTISGDFDALTSRELWKLSAQSITIVGVNCFTLISGYFGIRASMRGFLKLTFLCLFYSVGIATAFYLYDTIHSGTTFPWQNWCESWLVYSHTDLWYVPAYLGLYLLSPLLNATEQTFSNRRFAAIVGSFTLFTVWCGWWWGGRFNPTGYTVMQLILMYLIGAGVRRFTATFDQRQRIRTLILGVGIYLAGTAATFLISLYLDPINAFAYNSPAVIAASTGLLMTFTSFGMRSHTVNRIAASAFAVYLIHKNPLIWVRHIKPLANKVWELVDWQQYTLLVIGFTLAVYAICWMIDLLRIQIEKMVFRIPLKR